MENKLSVQFKLISIAETLFEDTYKDLDISGLTENGLQVQFQSKTRVDVAKNSIEVLVGVIYGYNNAQVIKLEMTAIYSVKSLSDAVEIDNDKRRIKFKIDIIPTLLSSTLGIVRGAMFEKTVNNSILSQFPVPLVPMEILVAKNTMFIV